MTICDHPTGAYRWVPGIEPYSGGVIATDGFEVMHLALDAPVEWTQGFGIVGEWLTAAGLSRSALVGVELRCPEPHSFDGFADFNRAYRQLLDDWRLLLDGDNPVARTNVAPVHGSPADTLLHGVSVVRPAEVGRPTFTVAGAGDLVDQSDLRPEAIVAGEWRVRVEQVLDEMESRMAALGVGWDLATQVNVYCASPSWTEALDVLVGRVGSAVARGLSWTVAHPPITGLRFEMDVHGHASSERIR